MKYNLSRTMTFGFTTGQIFRTLKLEKNPNLSRTMTVNIKNFDISIRIYPQN